MDHLFWIDLEMTGLDSTKDRILEAAVIITNTQYEEVSTWDHAVYQSNEVLKNMNAWCQDHHHRSGLTARVPHGISEQELDHKLLELAEPYWNEKNPIILCGNSIHQDRKFIDQYLPLFSQRLHYRMLDVSSFKVLFQEIHGCRFKKKNTHLALDDIRESISEFVHYQKAIDPSSLI